MNQRNVDEKRLMRVAQGVEDAGGIFEQVRGAKGCMLEATKMRSGNACGGKVIPTYSHANAWELHRRAELN